MILTGVVNKLGLRLAAKNESRETSAWDTAESRMPLRVPYGGCAGRLVLGCLLVEVPGPCRIEGIRCLSLSLCL